MAEDYKPQKHEYGKPESAQWAKSMTPGQEKADMPHKKKKIKEFKEYIISE